MPADKDHAPQSRFRFAFLIVLCTAAYLYLCLFDARGRPFLLGGDQVFFWTYAQRMLLGQRIYQDFFQFTPPGTDLAYLAAFKLFGPTTLATNLLVLALGVTSSWLFFSIAKQILQTREALLATAIWVVFAYGKALNATHHWFSALAILAAIRIFINNTRPARALIAGALLGLATFFTQTHGLLSLLAFFIAICIAQWQQPAPHKKFILRASVLLIGYAASMLLLYAHLLATVGLERLWYFQITAANRIEKGGGILGLGNDLSPHNLPHLLPYILIYLLTLIGCATAGLRCWRTRHRPFENWWQITLLSSVGVALTLEIAISLNWLRLFAVAFAGILLFVWSAQQRGLLRRSTVAAIWLILVAMAVHQVIGTHRQQKFLLRLPAGQTAMNVQAYEKLAWLAQHTSPGQSFFQVGWPGAYLPLHLHSPVFLDVISPEQHTRPEDIALAIRQLDAARTPFILWQSRLDTPQGPDIVEPLRNYLQGHYSIAHRFSDGDTVWQRN